MNIHWDGYGTREQGMGGPTCTIPNLQGNYHIFGLLWTPTEYVFSVDGVTELTVTNSRMISQGPEWIILGTDSNDLTGDWESPPAGGYGSLATSTTNMVVDTSASTSSPNRPPSFFSASVASACSPTVGGGDDERRREASRTNENRIEPSFAVALPIGSQPVSDFVHATRTSITQPIQLTREGFWRRGQFQATAGYRRGLTGSVV